MKIGKAAAVLGMVCLAAGCSVQQANATNYAMSTIVSQTVWAKNPQEVCEKVQQTLTEFENQYSLYRSQSEVKAINDAAGKEPVQVSQEMYHFLQNALRLEQGYEDCFALTMAPVTLAWGVYTESPRVVPSEERAELLELVDDSTLKLLEDGTVQLEKESQGLDLGGKEPTTGRLVAALRRLGFDYVFDTDFAADVTIMEEASELIEHLKEGAEGPMFTSCCPGWVRFAKTRYPELAKKLSTTKSPQQIFGALAKTYYAEILGVDPAKIFVVSYMPCVAKKMEAAYPGMDSTGTGPDVDAVLSVRELTRQLRQRFVNVDLLEEEDFDRPLGVATGAGHIFGVTGGVMEAALRTAYNFVTGENPDADAFHEIRSEGPERGWREKEFQLPDRTLRIAVASGLANADALCRAIERGEASYDFVEVMACPGGCVGGGGQPIIEGFNLSADRGCTLRIIDEQSELRFSHENPAVQACYADFLEKPLSETHTSLPAPPYPPYPSAWGYCFPDLYPDTAMLLSGRRTSPQFLLFLQVLP